MDKRDMDHLERKINEVQQHLLALSSDNPLSGLIPIIHRPGWTTLAELELVTGMLDAMASQTAGLAAMKRVILSAAEKVMLNPQPLPP